jgi:hypothetical protein
MRDERIIDGIRCPAEYLIYEVIETDGRRWTYGTLFSVVGGELDRARNATRRG